MLRLIFVLLWSSALANVIQQVNIDAACTTNDCHKISLVIESGGQVLHALSLVERSELQLSNEICHYYGMESGTDFVAISKCGEEFVGRFIEAGSLYELDWDDDADGYQLTHLMSDNERGLTGSQRQYFCATPDEAVDKDGDIGSSRSVIISKPFVEAIVFMDIPTQSLIGDNDQAFKYTTDVLNAVSSVYERNGLPIDIRPIGIRFIENLGFRTDAQDIDVYLDIVTAFYHQLSSTKTKDSEGRIHGTPDLVISFVGRGLSLSDPAGRSGVAYTGAICNTTKGLAVRTTVLNDNNRLVDKYTLIYTIVHEIGHSLGLCHLNNKKCDCQSTESHIMLSFVTEGSLNRTFTQCSIDKVRSRMDRGVLHCLFREDLSRERRMPATRYILLSLRIVVGSVSGILLAVTVVLMVRFLVQPPDFALQYAGSS